MRDYDNRGNDNRIQRSKDRRAMIWRMEEEEYEREQRKETEESKVPEQTIIQKEQQTIPGEEIEKDLAAINARVSGLRKKDHPSVHAVLVILFNWPGEIITASWKSSSVLNGKLPAFFDMLTLEDFFSFPREIAAITMAIEPSVRNDMVNSVFSKALRKKQMEPVDAVRVLYLLQGLSTDDLAVKANRKGQPAYQYFLRALPDTQRDRFRTSVDAAASLKKGSDNFYGERQHINSGVEKANTEIETIFGSNIITNNAEKAIQAYTLLNSLDTATRIEFAARYPLTFARIDLDLPVEFRKRPEFGFVMGSDAGQAQTGKEHLAVVAEDPFIDYLRTLYHSASASEIIFSYYYFTKKLAEESTGEKYQQTQKEEISEALKITAKKYAALPSPVYRQKLLAIMMTSTGFSNQYKSVKTSSLTWLGGEVRKSGLLTEANAGNAEYRLADYRIIAKTYLEAQQQSLPDDLIDKMLTSDIALQELSAPADKGRPLTELQKIKKDDAYSDLYLGAFGLYTVLRDEKTYDDLPKLDLALSMVIQNGFESGAQMAVRYDLLYDEKGGPLNEPAIALLAKYGFSTKAYVSPSAGAYTETLEGKKYAMWFLKKALKPGISVKSVLLDLLQDRNISHAFFRKEWLINGNLSDTISTIRYYMNLKDKVDVRNLPLTQFQQGSGGHTYGVELSNEKPDEQFISDTKDLPGFEDVSKKTGEISLLVDEHKRVSEVKAYYLAFDSLSSLFADMTVKTGKGVLGGVTALFTWGEEKGDGNSHGGGVDITIKKAEISNVQFTDETTQYGIGRILINDMCIEIHEAPGNPRELKKMDYLMEKIFDELYSVIMFVTNTIYTHIPGIDSTKEEKELQQIYSEDMTTDFGVFISFKTLSIEDIISSAGGTVLEKVNLKNSAMGIATQERFYSHILQVLDDKDFYQRLARELYAKEIDDIIFNFNMDYLDYTIDRKGLSPTKAFNLYYDTVIKMLLEKDEETQQERAKRSQQEWDELIEAKRTERLDKIKENAKAGAQENIEEGKADFGKKLDNMLSKRQKAAEKKKELKTLQKDDQADPGKLKVLKDELTEMETELNQLYLVNESFSAELEGYGSLHFPFLGTDSFALLIPMLLDKPLPVNQGEESLKELSNIYKNE